MRERERACGVYLYVSVSLFQRIQSYTLRTNGALKDLTGSFTLSQIQDPILVLQGTPTEGASKDPLATVL